jgi:ubiquinone/menaquinone biosynthesis C-methylase UbiE
VFEAIEPATRDRMLDNGATFFAVELPAVAAFVPERERMRASGVPLTVVAGEQSRATWFGHAARWLAEGTGAARVEIPGGHVGFSSHPAAFVALVRRVARETGDRAEDPPTRTQEQTQIRDAWSAIAAGYDEFVTPTHLWLGREALRRAGLRSGMRVLDVAAGSGALSIPAARLGARVLSVDLSPAMVERLLARARSEGLSLEARAMDGHRLELEDGSFDLVGSQFGVMLFPDLPRGVREMVRVARPGGRVLVVAYGPPEQVEFLRFFMEAVRTVVPDFPGLPDDPPPLPFQVADPATLRRVLEGAGLRDVHLDTVAERLEFRSAAHMWNWVTSSNPIGAALVAGLGAEQCAGVREALGALLRERSRGSGPAVLTNPVHIATGTT